MPRSRARARGAGAGIRRTTQATRGRRWGSRRLLPRPPRGASGAGSPRGATEPRQIPVGRDQRRAAVPCCAVGVLRMPVVWTPATDAHCVDTGVWCGVTIENDELPERAHVLLEACRAAGAPIQPARDPGWEALEAVHTPPFLALLRTAYERWVADGHLEDPGAPYAVAYWFPAVAGRRGGDPARPAATIRAELGRYAMDTMTPVGPGTWEGAKAASDAAATAADLVLGRRAGGVRDLPPAGAPRRSGVLRRQLLPEQRRGRGGSSAAGRRRPVAVVDIDAHHGNGTQACCWDDPAVLYASLHVDPGAGWFPHTVGYADEVDATRTNRNLPLAPGTGDAGWLAALEQLATVVERFDPDAVVVSLGVDAAAEDPNSPLEVTHGGVRGRRPPDRRSWAGPPCSCTRAATCWRRWPPHAGGAGGRGGRGERRARPAADAGYGRRAATPHDRSLSCSATRPRKPARSSAARVSSTYQGNSSAKRSSTSGWARRAADGRDRVPGGHHEVADDEAPARRQPCRGRAGQRGLLVGRQVVDGVGAHDDVVAVRPLEHLEQVGRHQLDRGPELGAASSSILCETSTPTSRRQGGSSRARLPVPIPRSTTASSGRWRPARPPTPAWPGTRPGSGWTRRPRRRRSPRPPRRG